MSHLDIELGEVVVAVGSNNPIEVQVDIPSVDVLIGMPGPTGPQGPQGQWMALTQEEYDALSPPDPDVLYVIVSG